MTRSPIELSARQLKKIHKLFTAELGCQPPLFTQNVNDMCNRKFNASESKERELFQLFLQMLFQDWKSNCKIPCTKSRYTTRYLSKSPHTCMGLNNLFDKTVDDLTHPMFSINEQDLLTRIGGAVSSQVQSYLKCSECWRSSSFSCLIWCCLQQMS